MTVRELIDALEDYGDHVPVILVDAEATPKARPTAVDYTDHSGEGHVSIEMEALR